MFNVLLLAICSLVIVLCVALDGLSILIYQRRASRRSKVSGVPLASLCISLFFIILGRNVLPNFWSIVAIVVPFHVISHVVAPFYFHKKYKVKEFYAEQRRRMEQ